MKCLLFLLFASFCFFLLIGDTLSGKKNGRGNRKRFDKAQVKAAFKDLGADDELELDHAKEMRHKKTGTVFGRLRLMHQNLRVWGGPSVMFKGDPDASIMKPLRGTRKNLSKKSKGAQGRKSDPNLSIAKCVDHFNYPSAKMEKSTSETVWYDHDNTDSSPMLLCHYVTADGKDKNDEIYSVGCLIQLGNKLKMLAAWHEIEPVFYGGNLRTSAIPYETLPGTASADGNNQCSMVTPDGLLSVFDAKMTSNRTWQAMTPISYNCSKGPNDPINGAYSPTADCIFNGAKILQMFFDEDWGNFDSAEQICALGKMNIIAHFGKDYANAFWSTSDMGFYVGDGGEKFHPLCSCPDVVAHEMGHALTSVRSRLIYAGESGCMNEAFSDMLGEAAENYIYGKNDWLIAKYCLKTGEGIRNMASFKSYADYKPGTSVHSCSGIYNSAFYKLSTLNGRWNIRRAFTVFLTANSIGWTEDTGMVDGWCEVVWAAYEIAEEDYLLDACDVYNVGKMHGMDCSKAEYLQEIITSC